MTNNCYFFRKIRDMRPNNDARDKAWRTYNLKLNIYDIDKYISKSPTYSSEFQESKLSMSCETYEKQKFRFVAKKIQANSKSEQILLGMRNINCKPHWLAVQLTTIKMRIYQVRWARDLDIGPERRYHSRAIDKGNMKKAMH
jgi:hypothetical protein